MRYIQLVVVTLFILTLTAFITSTILLNYNKDTENPVITSDFEKIQISVDEGEEGLLKGLKATDDRDGDITENIFVGKHSPFIERGTCKVTYLVFDSSNNVGSYTRTVTFKDYSSPEVCLNKPLIYEVGQPITILDRLSVSDSIEGDISDKVKIVSSNINNSEPGSYKIGIEAINGFGDAISIDLPVHIVKTLSDVPEIRLSAYLVTVPKASSFEPSQYIEEIILPNGSQGNISEVDIESNVDTATAGTYQTIYSYTENDRKGITALTVVVKE